MNLEQQCNAIVRAAFPRRKREFLLIDPRFGRLLVLERLLKAPVYRTFSTSHQDGIFRDYQSLNRRLYG